jgi:hypothetical protein
VRDFHSLCGGAHLWIGGFGSGAGAGAGAAAGARAGREGGRGPLLLRMAAAKAAVESGGGLQPKAEARAA